MNAIRCVAITESHGAENLLCGPAFPRIVSEAYQDDGTDLMIYNKGQDGATFQTALTGTQYGGKSAVDNGATLTPQCWIVALGTGDWLFNIAGRKGADAEADAAALFARIRSYGGHVIYMQFQQVAPGTAPDFDAFQNYCGGMADDVCVVPYYLLREANLLMNDGPAMPQFGEAQIHATTIGQRFIAGFLLDTLSKIWGIARQPYVYWDSAAQALAARTSTDPVARAAWAALVSNWNG